MATYEQLQQYAADPRVHQMLTLISRTQGTFGAQNPYAVYGGDINKQLPSLAAHPGKSGAWQFKWNDGRKGTATASGRYQIVQGTWDGLAKRYGFKDFGQRNQDLAAVALMADAGAIDDIRAGRFQDAAKKLGRTWASLPSSPYAQAKRSQSEFDKMLAQTVGGSATAPTPRAAVPASAFFTAPKSQPAQNNMGIGPVITPATELSTEELAAIMPTRMTAPQVVDDFFTDPPKVDWGAYYK